MKKEIKPDLEELPKKKSIIDEFREFITRGNVIELAVGLTVGTAFTKLVNSFVTNLIMPIVGLFLKGESFRDLYIALNGEKYENIQAAEAAKAPLLKYGQLISDSLDFVIIAAAIFLMIKVVNKIKLQSLLKEGMRLEKPFELFTKPIKPRKF